MPARRTSPVATSLKPHGATKGRSWAFLDLLLLPAALPAAGACGLPAPLNAAQGRKADAEKPEGRAAHAVSCVCDDGTEQEEKSRITSLLLIYYSVYTYLGPSISWAWDVRPSRAPPRAGSGATTA